MSTQPKLMDDANKSARDSIAAKFDWENMEELPAGWKLPTHLDLPESGEQAVENFADKPQAALITQCIQPILDEQHPNKQYWIGSNSCIYWQIAHPEINGAIVPGWFYVPGVPPLLDGEQRRSYVLWQEKIAPLIVLEFVPGSGEKDRDATPLTGKFWIYEQAVKATYYGILDSTAKTFELFHLDDVKYKPVAANDAGRRPIPELQIQMGVWEGDFGNRTTTWLRLWDANGNMLPTANERAAQAQQRRAAAEQQLRAEHQQREAAEIRAELLTAQLRTWGFDAD